VYGPAKAIVPCFLLLLTACGASGPRSDWERAHEEKLPAAEQPREVAPAPPAKRGELLEFSVAPTSEFRFFVDAASLSVGSDGIVRYVLVARSPEGTENVSFEGMRCATREVRIYALGRDGAWVGRETDWRPIQPRGAYAWHEELYREYFCPYREPIGSAAKAVQALRTGGR
jgi:CNP1-like family